MEPNQQPEQPVQPVQPTPQQPVPQQATPQQPMSKQSAQEQPAPEQVTPQNDFLARIDTTMTPVNPIPEKKGLSRTALIGIIAGAVAVVAIVVIVLINIFSKPATQPVSPTPNYPDEPEVSEEIKTRNELRTNDLVKLKEAVVSFQSKNGGALPGSEIANWNFMIQQYIPGGITDGATGEIYQIAGLCKFGEACVNIDELSWEMNHHQIYVLLNATCNGNTKTNVVVSSTKKRQAAMFTILEDSKTFLCVAN